MPASDSQLSFSNLGDGPHSLTVAAVDALQHVETAPLRYDWTVDTVPPTTTAALVSPYYSNASSATASVSCGGEAFPWLCSYCWDVIVDGVPWTTGSCSGSAGPGSVVIPAGGDGVTSVVISAVDGASNRDNRPVNVTWVHDTTPPVVMAVHIVSTTVWVPAIGTYVVNTTAMQVRQVGGAGKGCTDCVCARGGVGVDVDVDVDVGVSRSNVHVAASRRGK